MMYVLVNTTAEIDAFNNGIIPLMLASGQIMECWVDEAQCPHNSATNQYAIATGCSGTRRQVMEQYLATNGLVEVELSQDDEDWFPPMPEMFNTPTP